MKLTTAIVLSLSELAFLKSTMPMSRLLTVTFGVVRALLICPCQSSVLPYFNAASLQNNHFASAYIKAFPDHSRNSVRGAKSGTKNG